MWQFMVQNTSQGSVATCAWCGGIINNQFAANLKESVSERILEIG